MVEENPEQSAEKERRIRNMANSIRFLSLDSILNAREGHQGAPLGMAEIAATLYASHLKVNPEDPLWPDRDRVVLSNGHGSMLLYSLLHLSGYGKMDMDALGNFRKLGSLAAGHPEIEQSAGIEITTGLLGQGIACAVGMAVAEARLSGQFGSELVDHRTWAFVGDGCLQEGVGQEAISLAGHLQLGKLTFIWDDNRITDDGDVNLSISENVPARFKAAGWHVIELDGHNIAQIDRAIKSTAAERRPSLLACRTIIARGIPRLQGTRGGHSAPLNVRDSAEARGFMEWPHGAFEIPDEIYGLWREAMNRGRKANREWRKRVEAHPKSDEFWRWTKSALPENWNRDIGQIINAATFNAVSQPTISASADLCERLAGLLPESMVLCADLEAPTDHKRGRAVFNSSEHRGSYIHCGVREHLMGAMTGGIASHGGLRPVNVTYLAFADYERPAMRMAALMGLPGIFVFSHDSIGVGSNGPTHQPVEILASFRAMPNINVFRPADAAETCEAWQIAIETTDRPTILALSRQPSRPARLSPPSSKNQSRKGAYVLHEAKSGRDITLLATGTEVGLAVLAREKLEEMGIHCAVVSMPCWELFEIQNPEYQSEILGEAPRIGIEAAMRFGWERWLRKEDAFIGMKGFGASAASEVLYQHFGIDEKAVVETACSLSSDVPPTPPLKSANLQVR
ncbi:MAG: transketolase [Roseovarius sp.]|nr:transketolase [Roseovarius sp.]